MRKTITKTYHKTRVSFSYVEVLTGKTFTQQIYLDNWLNNMSYINTQVNTILNKNIGDSFKVYSINSVEHVSIRAYISDENFLKLATIDKQSIVVIKKLR